jgi:BirA family biotin operon repressor/biotin-[acetyl-CoA-carboxylase] ligase
MPKTIINPEDITNLLKVDGGYLSGEAIAAKIGVSRAAVWKTIGQLKKNGYVIESSQSRGYRLISSPDLCMPDLKAMLSLAPEKRPHELFFFDTAASTNILAMDMAARGCVEGTVVIADTQTAGKGRLGRVWLSPAGKNLYMSMVVRPDIPPRDATALTLLSAVACASALINYGGVAVTIKWPNDLIAGGLKIGGILTEIRADIDRIYHAVVGIGINVNLSCEDMPAEITRIATSVLIETGGICSRTGLVAEIITEFDRWYGILLTKGKKVVMERWIELSDTIGKQIRVAVGDLIFEGTAEGVDDEGLLIVKLADGSCRKFSAGDVTIGGARQ